MTAAQQRAARKRTYQDAMAHNYAANANHQARQQLHAAYQGHQGSGLSAAALVAKLPYYCRTYTMWNANPYYRKGPRNRVKCQVNTINISDIYRRKGELATAFFKVGGSQWRILVYVFGKNQSEGMSVYLHHFRRLPSAPGNGVETEFRCTIQHSQDRSKHHARELRHRFTGERPICGFDIFIPLQDLYNCNYLFGAKKDTIVLRTEL